jgi:hypothetical protein
MFIPHQPEPIRAVRYLRLVWALSMAGAEKVRPVIIELFRKARRLIDMIISPLLLIRIPHIRNPDSYKSRFLILIWAVLQAFSKTPTFYAI